MNCSPAADADIAAAGATHCDAAAPGDASSCSPGSAHRHSAVSHATAAHHLLHHLLDTETPAY